MKIRTLLGICGVLSLLGAGCAATQPKKEYRWAVNDPNRPLPKVVTPGQTDAEPPSDAVVLFDGKDLSKWEIEKGKPAAWKVENGYMEIAPRTGNILTKQSFGSCQLHIEWASPSVVEGKGQEHGNSGIFLMNTYEVQVLDSYDNVTYADGQAGSIYSQNPPLVNVSRQPAQWQSYDIIFHRPIFKDDKVVKPGTVTVLQNGVLVQDNWVLEGPTMHKERTHYVPHADKLPISLQDHSNPVRYRNIWIRELAD
jgi:hypothetical protein